MQSTIWPNSTGFLLLCVARQAILVTSLISTLTIQDAKNGEILSLAVLKQHKALNTVGIVCFYK